MGHARSPSAPDEAADLAAATRPTEPCGIDYAQQNLTALTLFVFAPGVLASLVAATASYSSAAFVMWWCVEHWWALMVLGAVVYVALRVFFLLRDATRPSS